MHFRIVLPCGSIGLRSDRRLASPPHTPGRYSSCAPGGDPCPLTSWRSLMTMPPSGDR
ncbi:MAG: hypothetical protein MZV64_73680 [Ignavibacteriales bacterium]|nr:hypothetical protein [Ignavibacteriales bacterium]